MIMVFTKPIEHFNLQRKKVITMNTLYVDIDVSRESNVAYLMLPNGDKHSNFSVANSHESSTQLVKRIHSALTSHSLDTVLIGLEATSVYGDNLVYFLREDATLAQFNRKFHVLNPKQVKKFHDTYNGMIMWTLLLLLTACVSVESTKRYIWETTVIKLSKTSHGHVSSLFRVLLKKSSDS